MTKRAMYWALIRTEAGYALEAIGFVMLVGLIATHARLRERWDAALVVPGGYEKPTARDVTDVLKAFAACMALVNVTTYACLKLIYGAAI